MYYNWIPQENIRAPFEIVCTICGSHNVDIFAEGYLMLEIICRNCGATLECGEYNEVKEVVYL